MGRSESCGKCDVTAEGGEPARRPAILLLEGSQEKPALLNAASDRRGSYILGWIWIRRGSGGDVERAGRGVGWRGAAGRTRARAAGLELLQVLLECGEGGLRAGDIVGLQRRGQGIESLGDFVALLPAATAAVVVMMVMDLAGTLLLLLKILLDAGVVLLRRGEIAILQILR